MICKTMVLLVPLVGTTVDSKGNLMTSVLLPQQCVLMCEKKRSFRFSALAEDGHWVAEDDLGTYHLQKLGERFYMVLESEQQQCEEGNQR
jgi:hypothetical protein